MTWRAAVPSPSRSSRWIPRTPHLSKSWTIHCRRSSPRHCPGPPRSQHLSRRSCGACMPARGSPSHTAAPRHPA
eukprot:scaffold301_cov243-Pinguiococcus_pyrenoidosus.AAC.31